jgi:autotransporter-associated beta strand protein
MNASGLVNNAITEFAITGSNDVTWTNNSLRGSGTYVKTGTGTANIDHFNGANGNMNVVIENGKLNTLGGNNNYWAVNNTIVKSDGTLQVNTHTHIKNVTLQGGTLYAGGADATWGSLMFDNDITANGSAVSTISGTRIALANADNAIRTFTVESGSTLNITGDLENANLTTNNQLTKSGAGILTLAGSNTYTGATTVSAGTLFVTGALANSSVTVNSSGTLGGTGSIGGNLTLDAGANLDVTPGLLTITGSITLTDFSFADIIGWDAASAADGTYTLLNGGSSVTFNGNTPTLSNPYQFSSTKIGYFQQGSLQAVIATVPETSTVLLTGLGSLLLIRRRRT